MSDQISSGSSDTYFHVRSLPDGTEFHVSRHDLEACEAFSMLMFLIIYLLAADTSLLRGHVCML
jgi:hypothetical protein